MKETKHFRLASWESLPADRIHEVFPDAIRLGEMTVDFGLIRMDVYRFKDAAGNDAFAFDRGQGLVSHGSQNLTGDVLAQLRKVGAAIGGSN